MIEQAFITLLRVSAEFSLILLALLTLRHALRRFFGASCAYSAWLLVPLLLIVAQLPASRPGLLVQAVVEQELPVITHVHVTPIQDWTSVYAAPLLTLWLAVVVVFVIALALRQRRFMRALLLQTDKRGWQGPVGSGPALVGLWPARLCLPLDFERRFTPEQQRLILAHEDVHRARQDNAWNLLALSVCVLQWFNPLAWLALRALRVDQELSCDAVVLRAEPAWAAEYAKALLNAQGSPAHALPWASWRSAHPLVERISMLKLHATARRRAGLLTLSLIALFGASAVHALQSEPAVNAAVGKADVRLKLNFAYTEFKTPKRDLWKLETQVDTRANQTVVLKLPLKHANDSSESAQAIEVTLSAKPNDKGQWLISMQVRKGEPWHVLAKPQLLVADSTMATVKTGTDGVDQFKLEVTPTRLHPGLTAN